MNNLEEVKMLFQLLFPEWKCTYASTNSFILDHAIQFIQLNDSVYFSNISFRDNLVRDDLEILNKIRSKFFVLTAEDLLPTYYALGGLRNDTLKGSN